MKRHPAAILRCGTACLAFAALLPLRLFGQTVPSILVFDEDDAVGTGYYDASYGFASGGSSLTRGGTGTDKLLIDNTHSHSGAQSGFLRWTSVTGGAWKIFVASPDWTVHDASTMDTLEFHVNASAAIGAGVLPLVAMESNTGASTSADSMGTYLPAGIDADSTTWQRVAIPLSAFQPFGSFSLAQFKDINFGQGAPDNAGHSLWFDYVRLTGRGDTTHPAAPGHVVTRVGDRCIILHWDTSSGTAILGYNIFRSNSATGPFEKMNSVPIASQGYCDLTVTNGSMFYYYVTAVSAVLIEGSSSQIVECLPHAFADDEEFLNVIEETAVDFFWYEANPTNGMVRDRSATWSSSSIAATGFGLTALCIGVDRGWLSRAQARDRTLTTLNTFWTQPQGDAASGTIGYKGFFYHFLDMTTATRNGTSELSSGDTGDLIAGILYAKQYFTGSDSLESRIRALADSIADRVDWTWMMNGGTRLTMGWSPEGGFLSYRYEGYSEAMIFYLIGLGSTTHPIPDGAWSAWTSTYQWATYYGHSFVLFPPLFGHQASHSWIDFRSVWDAYMKGKGLTYFENSRRATLAQREYCIANPLSQTGYGANTWGLTASDEPSSAGYHGYSAHGAPPSYNDNGTLAPAAPASSVAFTPTESIAALRSMYDQYRSTIFTPYGFCDAFNLKESWWDPDVIGFDQGTTALMIENYRTGSIWSRFMQDSTIQRGMRRAGFEPIINAVPGSAAGPVEFALHQNYPNPFNPTTTIWYSTGVVSSQSPVVSGVRIAVYDVLGREVAVLLDEYKAPGTYRIEFDGAKLSSGVYICRMTAGDFVECRKMLLLQ